MPTSSTLEMGLPASEGPENTATHGHGGAGTDRRRHSDRLLGSEDDQRWAAPLPDHAESFRAGGSLYERFLADDRNRQRVVEAYRRTCKLLRNFNVVAQKIAHVPPIDDPHHWKPRTTDVSKRRSDSAVCSSLMTAQEG